MEEKTDSEPMVLFILAVVMFMASLVFLNGCGASVHTENRIVVAVPPPQVTHTVTTKTFVPVYQPVVTSKTETNGGAPLHDVTVKPLQ